jgi:probable phosphoglycerate mutase
MELFIVRHGQTQWNKERIIQGNLDSDLTQLGIMQAMSIQERLFGVKFHKVYSSPAGRATTTTEIILENKSQKYTKVEELNEINLGSWEGKKIAEIEKYNCANHYYFWNEPYLYNPVEGENFDNVKIRVEKFIKRLNSSHKDERILIVSHTIVIRTLISIIEGKKLEQFWELPVIDPASLTIIKFCDGKGNVQLYGDTAHFVSDIKTNLDRDIYRY